MKEIISEKVQIRTATLTSLKAINEANRKELEANLSKQLINYILKNNYETIGFYYGFKPEINTPVIMNDIFKLTNSSLYLPRIEANYQLSFREYNKETQLETVQRKIMQPNANAESISLEDIDLLIVPGVAYQESGYRIGFGGGYYDRALANQNVETVSLIFNEQLYPVDSWQIEAHDIPIKRLIMPKKGEFDEQSI
ncbi:5-formyltetrahydrofolate cyclo-ligase [Aerococcaceae bacterium DSM 111021]|nr:5-formyltetrahydrofolate cyclo-ligase [Aerococcaceae bacterium DSM 111021]